MDLLRNEGPHSVDQLVEKVGVTATAIRQRLTRMMAEGLVERVEIRQGRGRPSHQYRLTKQGIESSGNNMADLARALWEQVQLLPDRQVQQTIIDGVACQLAENYGDKITGETTGDRLKSIAELFRQKEVPFVAEEKDGNVTLKIVGCAYPKLANENGDICELERKVLSKLANEQLNVTKTDCGCDNPCCTFEKHETKT